MSLCFSKHQHRLSLLCILSSFEMIDSLISSCRARSSRRKCDLKRCWCRQKDSSWSRLLESISATWFTRIVKQRSRLNSNKQLLRSFSHHFFTWLNSYEDQSIETHLFFKLIVLDFRHKLDDDESNTFSQHFDRAHDYWSTSDDNSSSRVWTLM